MPAPVAEILRRSTDCSSHALPGLRAKRPAGPGRDVVHARHRRVGSRRAVRAGGSASAELLIVHHGLFWGAGPRPDRHHAQASPAAPLRRRHRPRRLSPAARRPPRARQQRAARTRARRERSSSPSRLHRGEPIGFIADLPGEGFERPSWSRASATSPHASRSCSTPGPLGCDAWRSSRVPGPTSSRRRRGRADALLTGEPAERTMAQAREAGCTYRRRPLRDRDVRDRDWRAPRRCFGLATSSWTFPTPLSLEREEPRSARPRTERSPPRSKIKRSVSRSSRRRALWRSRGRRAATTGSRTIADLIPAPRPSTPSSTPSL